MLRFDWTVIVSLLFSTGAATISATGHEVNYRSGRILFSGDGRENVRLRILDREKCDVVAGKTDLPLPSPCGYLRGVYQSETRTAGHPASTAREFAVSRDGKGGHVFLAALPVTVLLPPGRSKGR